MGVRQRGFTLIEVLVAFAIAATSLTLLLRIHTNSSATLVMAEEYLVATELATSLIDEMSVTESSVAFEHTGRFDGKYDWSIQAEEYAVEAAADADVPTPFLLRELSVSISWLSRDRAEQIELRTVRPFIRDDEDGENPL